MESLQPVWRRSPRLSDFCRCLASLILRPVHETDRSVKPPSSAPGPDVSGASESPGPSGQPHRPTEAELVERFWARVRLFATRWSGDAAAADDVAQETLRRVLEALRAGRLENPAALSAFVYRTARHVCLERRRSQRREWAFLGRWGERRDAEVADPLNALVDQERCAMVRRALDRLSDGDRELLRMIYYEVVPTPDAALRLGITRETLRVRKYRALRRLSETLREEQRNVSNPPATKG